MNYQVKNCEEKQFRGIAKTIPGKEIANASMVIGELWNTFHQTLVAAEPAIITSPCIGLYTDYQTDGGYTVMVGSENLQGGLIEKTIPAGTYAVFSIHGDVQGAVMKAWEEINTMNLQRSYICDYEEYLSGSDTQHMDINIYIGLK